MGRGASPAGICQQLGLSVLSYLQTRNDSEEFRDREAQTQLLLSQNIAAALYRQAMEGSTSAQTFWLKTLPPPGWQDTANSTDSLDQLTDEELLNLAATQGITFPAEPAETDGTTSRP